VAEDTGTLLVLTLARLGFTGDSLIQSDAFSLSSSANFLSTSFTCSVHITTDAWLGPHKTQQSWLANI